MKNIFVILLVTALSGCAAIVDAPKNILGYSTRDMEAELDRAAVQTYQAKFMDVYRAVLEEASQQEYQVFQKDEVRGLIVLMDVPKMVNTTEVGVFLTVVDGQDDLVKVEISSRSTPAKRVVAQAIFTALAKAFPIK